MVVYLCIRRKKVQTLLGKETSDLLYVLLREKLRRSAKSCTCPLIKLRVERWSWEGFGKGGHWGGGSWGHRVVGSYGNRVIDSLGHRVIGS